MPRCLNIFSSSLPRSASSVGRIRGINSTIVTATPNDCIMHANSQPITPPPDDQ